MLQLANNGDFFSYIESKIAPSSHYICFRKQKFFYDHFYLDIAANPHALGGLPEADAHRFFVQILEAIRYIRSCGIIHLDLKVSRDNML